MNFRHIYALNPQKIYHNFFEITARCSEPFIELVSIQKIPVQYKRTHIDP